MLRAALNRLLSPDPPGPPARDRQDLAIVATINTMAKYLSGRDPFAVLDVSGSALTDSARKLVGEVTSPRLPKRLDQATPPWPAHERARAIEAARRTNEDESLDRAAA